MSRRNSGAGATASPPSTTTLSSSPPTSFTFPNHHLPLHPHPVLLQHQQLNNSHTAAPTTSLHHPNHHQHNNNNTPIPAVRANRDTAAAAAVSAAIGVVLSPLPTSSEPVARSPPRDLSAKGSSPATTSSSTLKVVADSPPTTRRRALTPALPPSPTSSSHSALLTTSTSPPVLRSLPPSWQPSPSSSSSSSPSSRLVMVPSPAGSRRGSVVVPLEVAMSLAVAAGEGSDGEAAAAADASREAKLRRNKRRKERRRKGAAKRSLGGNAAAASGSAAPSDCSDSDSDSNCNSDREQPQPQTVSTTPPVQPPAGLELDSQLAATSSLSADEPTPTAKAEELEFADLKVYNGPIVVVSSSDAERQAEPIDGDTTRTQQPTDNDVDHQAAPATEEAVVHAPVGADTPAIDAAAASLEVRPAADSARTQASRPIVVLTPAPGSPFGWTQNIVHRGTDRRFHLLSTAAGGRDSAVWRRSVLSTSAPPSASPMPVILHIPDYGADGTTTHPIVGGPEAALTPGGASSTHLIYAGDDAHLHELALWWPRPTVRHGWARGWEYRDLTALCPGAPLADIRALPQVYALPRHPGVRLHVIYTTAGGEVHMLHCDLPADGDVTWTHTDLMGVAAEAEPVQDECEDLGQANESDKNENETDNDNDSGDVGDGTQAAPGEASQGGILGSETAAVSSATGEADETPLGLASSAEEQVAMEEPKQGPGPGRGGGSERARGPGASHR